MNRALIPLFLVASACARPRLTESQEYYVGRGVAANAIAGSPLLSHVELERYVAQVGYTIALESDRPETFKGYSFGILQSDSINAFAAPGGFIFVTTGALRAMRNEDELAGVLAHEIAHVNLRHPEEAANRASAKAGALDLLGGVARLIVGIAYHDDPAKRETLMKLVEAFAKVLDELAQEVVNGYGRESELEADRKAVDFLTRPGVGYDPAALRDFVSRLPQKDRGHWATHPTLEGRVRNLEEEMHRRGVRASIDPARTRRFLEATAVLRR